MNKQFYAIVAIALFTVLSSQLAVAVSDMDKSTEVFKKLDIDNNGFISLKEAKANPDIDSAFMEGDSNKDGKLSMLEFETMDLDE